MKGKAVSCAVVIALIFLLVPMMCQAQEIDKLLAVKTPLAEVATKASLADNSAAPLQGPVEAAKPDKQASQSWYWRLLNGIAMGLATYNTQEQNDGRPPFDGTPR